MFIGNLQGLPKNLLTKIQVMSRLYNISIDCPQVYITGNYTGNATAAYNSTANATYIQPSIDFTWFNSSTSESESANITLSGLLTLEEGSNATDANFTAQFSLPRAAQGKPASHVKMLDTAFTGGNSSDPLPHGVDYWANFTVKLASSQNDSVYDVFFVNAYNFSSTHDDEDDMGGFQRRDSNDDDDDDVYDDAVQLLFTNETAVIDNSTFNTIIEDIGQWAANLTFLNNTCTANNSSSSSSRSGTA